MIGDACEPWVLEKAQLNTADVVVASTGDDEDNLRRRYSRSRSSACRACSRV